MPWSLLGASILCLCISTALAVGPQPPKVRPNDTPTFEPAEPETLDGAAFTKWISTQTSTGSKTLALAEGAYHVTPGSDQAHILLSGLSDVTIWMDSVNLTMSKVGLAAVKIHNCSNLVTYGPTVWWDVPGFSQATITDVQRTTSTDFIIQYHLDDGYDPSFLVNETTGKLRAEYTNPTTGRLEAGPGWSTLDGMPSPVNGKANTYSVTIPNPYFTPLVDYKLLARGQFILCNSVTDSNNTIINDYTLLNCAGFGFISSGNRKTTFNSFSLKPAPFPPPNGTELPARSSSADGIHSSGDYIGPTFDSCFFSALDDDCMAAHGSLYQVRGAGPMANSFLTPKGDAAAGDVLRFYSNGTYDALGTATVVSADTTSTPLVITVDHLPEAVQGAIDSAYWTNQMRVGSGFNVLNTHTTGNRGRGAIIKASNGLIANNLFEGVSYAALNLGPEFSSWNEADYVHNISITNNTIRDSNYINFAGAAFQIHGDGDNPVNGNSNISIQNLMIQNTTAAMMYVGASEGVVLGDITFEDVYQRNYTLEQQWPGAVASFQNVRVERMEGVRCVEGRIGVEGVGISRLLGVTEGIGGDVVGSC